jgi:hypothetical protein
MRTSRSSGRQIGEYPRKSEAEAGSGGHTHRHGSRPAIGAVPEGRLYSSALATCGNACSTCLSMVTNPTPR